MSGDQGYILFQRGHRDHSLFQEPDKLGAWLWINLAAAHTAYEAVFNGVRVHLEPGQLTFSIRFLAKKWRWSDKKVTRFLDALSRDQFVTIGTTAGATTGQTIITVCNWQEIQRRASSATTAATTATTTATTTKKKQLKQLEKNTVSTEGFDLWWRNYPLKVAKQAAERAYTKVIAAALISEPDLLAKTIAFAASWARRPADDRKFILHPATWLNGSRWTDELDVATAATLPPVNPADFTDAEWQDNLKLLRKRGEWSSSWGPQPGEQGCLVPSRLIVAPVPEGSLRAEAAAPLRRETPADW